MSTPLYMGHSATAGVLLAWLLVSPGFAQTAPDSTDSPESPRSAISAPSAGTGTAADPGIAATTARLVRVTSSFEVTHAGAVLRQVAKLFSSGFVRKDAEQLAHLIDALPAEKSQAWEFSGVRKGTTYPLTVRARIDEFGMLDLDFFTAPALAPSVRSAVDGYLNARGL